MARYLTTKPPKEAIRAWMAERQQQRSHVPSPQELQKCLNWQLVKPAK